MLINKHFISLSFDIEDWYHAAPISGASISKYNSLNDFLVKSDNIHHDCITESTLRILDILDLLNIKATFFVVADVSFRYHEITKRLKQSSHEIASHSLTHHSSIDSKTKDPLKPIDEWINEQIKAKETLEYQFEKEIIGFRAPNSYFANWMVKPLSEIGFKYDSSIAYNSLFNKTNIELMDIPTFPYRLNSLDLSSRNPDTELVELPWSFYKLSRNLILPAGGAFFFRLLGYEYFRRVLNQSLKNGHTMFYLHPLDISTKVIPEKNSKSRPGFWINKGKKTERNLMKLLINFKDKFTTCSSVYKRFMDEN